MKKYKTFWMVGEMTTIEGKEYKYRYQVTEDELGSMKHMNHFDFEITKVHELVNVWMKPEPSPEEEEFIGMFIDHYDVDIEDREDITWKEISESENMFSWDLYCLEVEGRELGLGWDHCMEVGDFYSMKNSNT